MVVILRVQVPWAPKPMHYFVHYVRISLHSTLESKSHGSVMKTTLLSYALKPFLQCTILTVSLLGVFGGKISVEKKLNSEMKNQALCTYLSLGTGFGC